MYFIYSDITIETDQNIEDVAKQVTVALSIKDLSLDESGRYESGIVYSVICFGLEFELVKDVPPLKSYHLSINTDIDSFDLDGSEKEVDGVKYVLSLLKSKGIKADVRDPKLLYD